MPRFHHLLVATATAAALLAQSPDPRLMLHYGAFDPASGEPAVLERLRAPADAELLLVQFETAPTAADRAAMQRLGFDAKWFAPHDGYVVRGPAADRARLAALPRVRFCGAFHPAYKLDGTVLGTVLAGGGEKARYVIVLVDPRADEAAAVTAVERVGGAMWRYAGGNLLIEADLTPAQVESIARESTVLWIQPWTLPGEDMNNARIQGGANYIETMGGHTGKGMRGHIMEGIYPNHPEYAANAYRTIPMQVFSGQSTTHGNATFGINFSSGVVANARGLMPDGQGYFTDYNYVFNTAPMSTAQNSRYGVVQAITDPFGSWRVMFQTASWGNPQITTYDARSAEMDWIIHQFDIPICQSQSNTGNQNSRPQAWAKNILSVGAVTHANTAVVSDDTQAGTSMGPANDGRIKPDLCAYYDNIHSTNGATSYTTTFSGTSGATPIVAGHLGLAIEMFTDGYFGHPATPSWTQRFDYKPHASTAKALLINTARQYDPAVNGNGATNRYRQGWGFPALHDMYDLRRNMLVIDELETLQQGQSRAYYVHVKPGTPQFRNTLVYADLPAATPFSGPHRVNDLNLRVTSPSGVVYHGNTGMATLPINLYTTPGGSPNTLDTVENVFVQNPQAGLWRVVVSAPLVALDQHVETPQVDSDFALVSSGIGAGRDLTGPQLDLTSSGPGNLQVSVSGAPPSYAEGYVFYSIDTARPLAMGDFLGIEADDISLLSLSVPAAAGDPLHFTFSAAPGVFPNAPYVWSPSIVSLLAGVTVDAVAAWMDATGAMIAASNVDRVVVQ